MKTIVRTEETGTLRAYVAAESYGTSVEILQALKNGESVEVETAIADALIADGYAKEA